MWLQGELLTTRNAKPLKTLAGLMDMALAQDPGKLDLSGVEPFALGQMSSGLIRSLGGRRLATLVLPENCPADIVERWARELHHVEIEPVAIVPERYRMAHARPPLPVAIPPLPPSRRGSTLRKGKTDRATAQDTPAPEQPRYAGIRRGHGVPPQRRPLPMIEAPRVPVSAGDLQTPPRPPLPSADALHEAESAVRLIHVWLLRYARAEGADCKTELSSDEADAIARLLLAEPERMTLREQRAFFSSKAALARRAPGKPLTLTLPQVSALAASVSLVEGRVAALAYSKQQYGDATPRDEAPSGPRRRAPGG
jgi:hypothetical protein